jgi:hypothetical protein
MCVRTFSKENWLIVCILCLSFPPPSKHWIGLLIGVIQKSTLAFVEDLMLNLKEKLTNALG